MLFVHHGDSPAQRRVVLCGRCVWNAGQKFETIFVAANRGGLNPRRVQSLALSWQAAGALLAAIKASQAARRSEMHRRSEMQRDHHGLMRSYESE